MWFCVVFHIFISHKSTFTYLYFPQKHNFSQESYLICSLWPPFLAALAPKLNHYPTALALWKWAVLSHLGYALGPIYQLLAPTHVRASPSRSRHSQYPAPSFCLFLRVRLRANPYCTLLLALILPRYALALYAFYFCFPRAFLVFLWFKSRFPTKTTKTKINH